MAKFSPQFSRLKAKEDTGFSSRVSGRLVQKNGVPNVRRIGLNPLERYSWYHTMLGLKTWKFLAFLIAGYVAINLSFALIYYLLGIEHLTGIDKSDRLKEFTDVFFFSSQTFTTVGYGRIAPVGFLASLVATFEAFLGLLGFAIATGLFYGRFSRPRAFLKFSQNALVAPYEDGFGLMFRLASYKNNLLTNAEVVMNVALREDGAGDMNMRFFKLKPELQKIDSLALNWTVVHKIDENSPLFERIEELILSNGIEFFIQIWAFDEGFANTVVQKTSYSADEIIFNAKFLPMYQPSEDNTMMVLDLDKINAFEKLS